MLKRRHPLSGAMYEVDDQGLVHVSSGESAGVYTFEGDYVSGDHLHVDAHLCGWLAGRQLPAGLQRNPKDMHPDVVKANAGAAR